MEHIDEMTMWEIRKRDFANHCEDLDALAKALGDSVRDVILETRGKAVRAEWKEIASKHGSNDIQALKDTLWKMVEESGFEFTSSNENGGVQFRVTKCPWADLARSSGHADWGFVCYCANDPHIVAGFNPSIGFKRSKTLMEGHDCCDHFYYIK